MDELNAILAEYFAPEANTSHARKRELENSLEAIKTGPDAFATASVVLSQDGHSHLMYWFCLSIYGDRLMRWIILTDPERSELRENLWNLLVARGSRLPPIALNKLVKLIADLGKMEFPQSWATFFDDIISLRFSSLEISLKMLKVAVEEFTSPKGGTATLRRQRLKHGLTSQSAKIIATVLPILQDWLQHTADSPSSPLFSGAIGLPPRDSAFISTIPSRQINGYKDQPAAICELSLQIIALVFAAVPISEDLFVPSVVGICLKFARVTKGDQTDFACLALTTINELLSHNYIPPDFVEFTLRLSLEVCGLLRYLLSKSNSDSSLLECLDEEYRVKFIDFLQCFVAKNVKRAESIPGFPMDDFLSLLFQFTFVQTSTEHFLWCLSAWETFVDYLNECKGKGEALQVDRYQVGLVQLAYAIVGLLMEGNGAKALPRLQNSKMSLDISGSEELRNSCSALIGRIADLYEEPLIQLIRECLFSFVEVLRHPSVSNYDFQDAAIVCQLVGQTNELFTRHFEGLLDVGEALVKGLLAVLDLALSSAHAHELAVKCCVICIGTINLFVRWISLFGSQRLLQPDVLEKRFEDLLNGVVTNCVRGIRAPIEAISIQASELLVSATYAIRSTFSHPLVRSLLSSIHSQANSFPSQSRRNIYRVASFYFVLPLGGASLSKEEWSSRQSSLVAFFHDITFPLEDILNSDSLATLSQQAHVKVLVCSSLSALEASIESVENESLQSKDMVFSVVKAITPKVLSLIALYLQDGDQLCCVLDFILGTFRSLRKQVSREYEMLTWQTLRAFLEILSEENICFLSSSEAGLSMLDKFLQLLILFVEDNSNKTTQLLPSVIKFLQASFFQRGIQVWICPFLPIFTEPKRKDVSGSEPVKSRYYDLICRIVLCHQSYFLGSQVRMRAKHSNSASPHYTELSHLLQLIANSFADSSSEIFRQNLHILGLLNEKLFLFSKDIFVQTMMIPFLDMFFKILLRRNYDFMREDIIRQVCAMMTANLVKMKSEVVAVDDMLSLKVDIFIPIFLSNFCSDLDAKQKSVLCGYLTAVEDASNAPNLIEALFSQWIGGPLTA
ncbi:armadillo-type protein [Zopfochytrium polystomum]|nr:armadillo-type protein [Zopfochytrium polystomum]